jgi:Mitochondrial glycoprotein
MNEQVYVRSVDFLTAAAAKLPEDKRDHIYQGPVFDELAPELQTAFETYLSDRYV